jgi:PAS domain S-box-containing protein
LDDVVTNQNFLRSRSEAIAGGLYEIIHASGFVPFGSVEVQSRLRTLTEQLIDLLLGNDGAKGPAKQIGAALADLHVFEPELIGLSQEYLFSQFTHDLPTERSASLLPRLAEMMGALASGYFGRAQQIILREQEEIRSAYTTAQEKLEHSVRQSEERYRSLVESADQAIFILDADGVFTFMNGSAANQLGGRPRDYVGKSMWDLFPQSVADSQMEAVRAALRSQQLQISESVTVLQGNEHWRETSLQPMIGPSGQFETVLGMSTDVTERKEAEAALKVYSERLAVLRHIDQAILTAQSPRAIAEATFEHVQQIIPCWGLKVILYDFQAKEYLVLAGDMEGFETGARYPIEDWKMAEQMRKGDSVLLSDIAEIGERSDMWRMLREKGGRALLNVPLSAHGELIGAFNVIADRTGVYIDQHAEVVGEIASSLAIAIQNAQLLESERKARNENVRLLDQIKRHAKQLEQRVGERTRELTALYEVTAVANEYLDLQTILDKSLDRALITLRCVAATIHQLNEESGHVSQSSRAILSGGTGLLTDFDEIGDQLARRVVDSGRTLEIQELAEQLGDPRVLGSGRLRKFVGVPMIAAGQVVGVLSAFRDGSSAFTSEEVALLGSIGDHLAGAIENARLREHAEQSAVLDERSRLARELHDSVTQALYSLTLFAEAAQDRANDKQLALVQHHLDEIGTTAHQALKEMRLMLYELRTSSRLDEGLIGSIRHRLDAVERRSGVRTHLITDLLEELPANLENGLYRIAHEVLNNVLKHAEASSVLVKLTTEDGQVFMEISDDGHGFDYGAVLAQGGMGLTIMRERAEAFDGKLDITSQPEMGTTVTVVANIG